MGKIIAGYPGIGKPTLAKKYKNVCDLDHMDYVYQKSELSLIPLEQRKGLKQEIHESWPSNFLIELDRCLKEYDYVLIGIREDLLKALYNKGYSFEIIYPMYNDLCNYYPIRYQTRGNSQDYIKQKIDNYSISVHFFTELAVPKIVLENNMYLEDYLTENNANLIK